MRACVSDHGQVLYGSNYWQRGPSDTHGASLSLGQTKFASLPLCPALSLSPPPPISISFSLSLFPLFFGSAHSLCVLNYFRMSPDKRGQGETLLFIYFFVIGNQKKQQTRTYFNSHHTFPICTNKRWKIPALIKLNPVCVCACVCLHVCMHHEKRGHLQ